MRNTSWLQLGFALVAAASSISAKAQAPTLQSLKLSINPAHKEVRALIGRINPIPIHLRLGAEVSPNFNFDGGIDFTLPAFHIIPTFTSRIDVEAIVDGGPHGINTLIPITFNQIFTPPGTGITGLYIGGGIGAYIAGDTQFGGKFFVGANITKRLGIEGDVQFPGFGDPLLSVQVRLPLG